MKQNDAVFQVVCLVLGQDGFSAKVELTEKERAEVVSLVTAGIIAGNVDFSAEAKAKYDTEAKVRSYTVGMVNNHLRKDKRLNGGEKYIIKNPGSRAGQADKQLKAMRALRATLTDATEIKLVDEAIERRAAEIKAAKVKTTEININALPEQFRHLVR